jgi:5-methylcytosine-specific restriction endonuclease McrA
MSRWFRFYDSALDDPAVQRLDPVAFREALLGAMHGEETPFSPHLSRGSDRPHASLWAQIRAFVFDRDNYTCRYCGELGGRLECDHVVPVSRGGTNDTENLTTACFRCNRSKRAKLVEEWQA